MTEKIKYVRRFPPAAAHDVHRIEHWLEELALEGLILSDFSSFFGWFLFRVDRPRKLHYRLEVVEKPQSFWSGDPKTPRDEALSLHEDAGWQFVFRWQDFFLYRSQEPHPVELYTDGEIYDNTLKVFKRKLWGGLITTFLCQIFIARTFWLYPLSCILVLGPWRYLAVILMFLSTLVAPVEAVIAITRLRRSVKSGIPQKPRHPVISRLYQLRGVLGIALTLAIFGIILNLTVIDKIQPHDPAADYAPDFPFVTLQELGPEELPHTIDRIQDASYAELSNFLFPLAYDYSDGGQVCYDHLNQEDPDSSSWQAAVLLDIQYMEAASPWLAQQAAQEFSRYYARSSLFRKGEVEVRPLPELGVDYAVGHYYPHAGLLRVILVQDNVAVVGRCSMGDDLGYFTTENWAALMAQQLLAQ